MSTASVLPPMTPCSHTGLSRPECCCRECCRALVGRYAPQLALTPSPLAVVAAVTRDDDAGETANGGGDSDSRARRPGLVA
jgi:hypothetical protein